MNRMLMIAILACGAHQTEYCSAEVLYQSALFLPSNPGGPWEGSSVSGRQFVGKRFHLSSTSIIESIGGHFFSGRDSIFGAIVALTSPTDFPDSTTLSTPDVLAHTVFAPITQPAADITAAIGPLEVPPGDYLVIFGSKQFGATGGAAMIRPNTAIPGEPVDTVLWSFEDGWWILDDPRPMRLTVHGRIVPEPSTLALSLFALAAAVMFRQRGH